MLSLTRSPWPVIFLAFLSVLDGLFTLYFLRHGASEANPLMRWFLLHSGALGFLIAKLAITGFCCQILYRHYQLDIAKKTLPIALAVYIVIVVRHIMWL